MIFITEILLAIMMAFKWWYSRQETARHRKTTSQEARMKRGRGRKRRRETIDREESKKAGNMREQK